MFRVGSGYDVHALTPGRKLILGGVQIESPLGLDGHSDADVLVHAVIDALLGAANLGDIGALFPDCDPQFKGADSLILLQKTYALLLQKGWRLSNIDSTIIAQKPKLSPFIEKMKDNLAKTLEVPVDLVSIKATTTEKLGFVGKEEGIAAEAVVLIHPVQDT